MLLLASFTLLHSVAVQEYVTACGTQTSGKNMACDTLVSLWSVEVVFLQCFDTVGWVI